MKRPKEWPIVPPVDLNFVIRVGDRRNAKSDVHGMPASGCRRKGERRKLGGYQSG